MDIYSINFCLQILSNWQFLAPNFVLLGGNLYKFFHWQAKVCVVAIAFPAPLLQFHCCTVQASV